MLLRFTIAVHGCELAFYEPVSVVLNTNPDLLSGFLEAMECFSEELHNPVKEIKFSNWIIYINKAPDFTIRLIVTEFIEKELQDKVFRELKTAGEQVFAKNPLGQTIKQEIINDVFVPILKPILLDAQETDEAKYLIYDPQSRLNLAGLGAVGKTSIKKAFLEHVTGQDALKTSPTLGVESTKKQIDFLQQTVNIQEFGGQTAFRLKYLTNKMLWNRISTLIYVVDIQKSDFFGESCNYLRSIVNIITEVNKKAPIIAIFFHKYDPLLRAQLGNNLVQCLKVFAEFQTTATIHLTSLLDNSSNIAIIKSVYQSLPSMMLQKMLEEELLKNINETLLPQFLPLLPNPSSPVPEDLVDEIRMSAVLFGKTYGAKFQKAWIKYLSGEQTSNPQAASGAITVKKEANVLLVNIKKPKDTLHLHTLLVSGALLGLTRNLQFSPPKTVIDTNEEISFQIQL